MAAFVFNKRGAYMKTEIIKENIERVPILILKDISIFPETMVHFDVTKPKYIKAIENVMLGNQKIFLVAQKEDIESLHKNENIYTIGTMAKVKQISKLPNKVLRVLVEGLGRCELNKLIEENEEFSEADVIIKEKENTLNEVEEQAMVRQIAGLFREYCNLNPKIGRTLLERISRMNNLGLLCDLVTINLPIINSKKQQVLEANEINERYKVLSSILINEIEISRIKEELAKEVKGRVEKNQKEYFLREQMHYIKEELGENGKFSDVGSFREELINIDAKESVKEKIKKEIVRFESLSDSSMESAVQRGYLETLMELPWNKASIDSNDIKQAEKILNEEHYGLEKVKERILEFLAVRTLTKQGQSPIICLIGPPGTGKTSIAQSVSNALNKKYVRISLGGVRDEAEIRGHRKTYVGAMPGRIASGLRHAGVNNPLMLLDEIDKVGSDYKGDAYSALLEVLDPDQNIKFRDHYVEIPIDLSNVLFIATANDRNKIPRPLLDRMEIIEISTYIENEKFHIAKDFLYAKQLRKNGLLKKQLKITDAAIYAIIQYYTREAGVRELERKIGEICRKTAKKILENSNKKITVTERNISDFLGKHKYNVKKANLKDEVGIVRGLAWTVVGGDTLQIEVNVMDGKGEIELTGQLGDVMKESARAGISYIRSLEGSYKIDPVYFKEHDIHIHIPEGAVPKDGPSAGITMALAVYSAITNRKVKHDVAMTGEITLRGRVLQIGGLKEKIIAAKTAGMKTVLVPKDNKPDIEEMEEEIKEGLNIIFVDSMKKVMEYALL